MNVPAERWSWFVDRLQQHRHWIVAGWLAGVALLWLRLLLGLIGADRARRRWVVPVSGAIDRMGRRLADRLDLRRTVRIFESALAEVPTLIGWLRPVILLPASALVGLTPAQLEALLAHELAHVARHDYLVNLVQTVVETILFYHPAVWWISRRIRQEREHCCDDMAVALCHDRIAYVRALAAMEELRAVPRWAVAASGGSLVERISRLVGRPEPAATGKPAFVAVALVLALAAGINAPFVPPASLARDIPAAGPVPVDATSPTADEEPAAGSRQNVQIAAKPDSDASVPPATAKRPAIQVISGRVTDEEGNPVADAVVTAVDQAKGRAETGTDAKGEFELGLPLSSRFANITVTDEAHARQSALLIGLGDSGSTSGLNIVIKPWREVTVSVVDAGNRPIAGATVTASGEYGELGQGKKTGPDGRVALRLPGNLNRAGIIALKDGAGYDYFSTDRRDRNNMPLGKVEVPAALTLRLEGARSVRVRAVNSRGEPLAGIVVAPWYVNRVGNPGEANFSGQAALSATTGADGVARFDWFPTDVRAGVTFWCRSEEYCAADRVNVKADDLASEIEMRLLRKSTISGRVLLPDGTPAAGMTVLARGAGVKMDVGHGHARTDETGAFSMAVEPNQAYLLAVHQDHWAGVRSGIVVLEDQPVSGVELRLVEATIVSGRITRGPEMKPVAGEHLQLQLQGGAIPEQIEKLRRPEDRFRHTMVHAQGARTDAEGRYRFLAGPGDYALMGPRHLAPVKFQIVDEKKIVRDFHLPREEMISLSGIVVDADGKPVSGATIDGRYASATVRRWALEAVSGADGRFTVERETQPVVLHAVSSDRKLGAIVALDHDQPDIRIELRPTSTARGRFLDADGQPMAGAVLGYAVRVHQGNKRAPWSDSFGGKVTTDASGRFTLPHLAAGDEWFVHYVPSENGPFPSVARTIVKGDGADIDLGDRRLAKPPVALTTEELIARQFRPDMPVSRRIEEAAAEARREYLRIMVVLADPAGDATKLLYQALRNPDDKRLRRAQNDYQAMWIKAISAADVAQVGRDLGVDFGDLAPPAVAVLGADGTLRATLRLPPAGDGRLDVAPLRELLATHGLPERDAEREFAAALARAKAENKRVFVQETATWCGPCRMLSRFIDTHRATFDANYVWLKIDRERQTHGQEVMTRIRGDRTGGIPWVAILDSDGRELGTSSGQDGENYGFPTEPDEIRSFLDLLKSTAPRLTDGEANALQAALENKPAPARAPAGASGETAPKASPAKAGSEPDAKSDEPNDAPPQPNPDATGRFRPTRDPDVDEKPKASKTNLRLTKPDAEGRFTLTFDNPLTRRDKERWKLDPDKHQVIFQVFVKDAEGNFREKLFRQLPARETGGYQVNVQVKSEYFEHSTVSLAFVTIQPNHDEWVKAFFHQGKGTSYKGIWSGDAAKLPAVEVHEGVTGWMPAREPEKPATDKDPSGPPEKGS